MATAAPGTYRPGFRVGPTSEFSLLFQVRRGEGDALRTALRDLSAATAAARRLGAPLVRSRE
jgi:hypothetical protein